jgi:hypothetical protein
LGGWDWEDQGSKPALANTLSDPHLQNNQNRDWWCDSSSRAPALQVQVLSSNASPTKNKQTKKKLSVSHPRKQRLKWESPLYAKLVSVCSNLKRNRILYHQKYFQWRNTCLMSMRP